MIEICLIWLQLISLVINEHAALLWRILYRISQSFAPLLCRSLREKRSCTSSSSSSFARTLIIFPKSQWDNTQKRRPLTSQASKRFSVCQGVKWIIYLFDSFGLLLFRLFSLLFWLISIETNEHVGQLSQRNISAIVTSLPGHSGKEMAPVALVCFLDCLLWAGNCSNGPCLFVCSFVCWNVG